MGLFSWIFLCGLVNLGVGFGLAVYLGYGPPTLGAAWKTLSEDSPVAALPKSARVPDVPPAAAPALPPSQPVPMTPARLEEMLDAGTDGHLEVEPYDEPYDDDVAELLTPAHPEAWDLNEKYVETSILKLNIAMMKSGARATEIDTRLRQCAGHSDVGTIQRCLDELITDCEVYLAEQSETAERFRARLSELGELATLGEEIETANLEQAAQIETTLSNLRHLDFQADLEAANTRLRSEIDHLRVARHRLRDSQEVAFLTVARYENRLDAIEKQLFNDGLTKIRNRIGFETTLWEWWRQGRHQSRQMLAALFDLDAFGRLNAQHGSAVGDRILCQIAQVFQESIGQADLLARYAGQRFFVVMLDVGPREGIKNAELLRQTIARLTFRHRADEIHLTTSSGLAEVKPEDTMETLFARVEDALRQAKAAGPNCTWLHDGRRAEPVESPNLGAEYREMEV